MDSLTVKHDRAKDGTIRRIIVFADWDHWVPQMLVSDLLLLLEDRKDIQLVGICVPRTTPHWKRMFTYWRSCTLGLLKRLLLNDTRFLYQSPIPVNPNALARRYKFQLLAAADLTNIGPDLERWRADIMFSIFWKQKFDGELLGHFRQAINYHNGTVPDYRGLRATQWSLYRNEARSGFTVHRIDEKLDCGNVLVADTVPINIDDSVFDIELRKTELAAGYIPAILDAVARNEIGIPQIEIKQYNDVRQIDRLRRIEQPASISSDELLRRIRAFGPVRTRHMHRYIWLSGLASLSPKPPGSDRCALKLRDGYWTMKRSDRFLATMRTIKPMSVRSLGNGRDS